MQHICEGQTYYLHGFMLKMRGAQNALVYFSGLALGWSGQCHCIRCQAQVGGDRGIPGRPEVAQHSASRMATTAAISRARCSSAQHLCLGAQL